MKISLLSFAVLIICVLFLITPINSQRSNAQFSRITPSTIVEDITARKRQIPHISAQELADYGNSLIKRQGLNFDFLTCDIAETNNQKSESNDKFIPYKYKLKDRNGKAQTYQIMNKNFGHPCGCTFDIPVYQISEKEMIVRVDGIPTALQRPKEFVLDEAELVDETLKKTIRRWYLPLDVVPFGISQDGTKIYVDLDHGEGHESPNELIALEIAENGVFQFVPRNNPNLLKNGVNLENFPKNPNNDYLGYTRFNSGKTNYIVKFSYPCT